MSEPLDLAAITGRRQTLGVRTWLVESGGFNEERVWQIDGALHDRYGDNAITSNDQAAIEFIAHAPADVAALVAAVNRVQALHRPSTIPDELYFEDCARCERRDDCEGHEVICCTGCYGRDEYGESSPIPWPCPTSAALGAVGDPE